MFGHVSGAHLNPAVTLAAWVLKAVSLPVAGLYILAQFVGGILGYGTILVSDNDDINNNNSRFYKKRKKIIRIIFIFLVADT